MDAVLESVACSLFNGELPDVWRKFAPATCKRLGSWMDHFEKRIEQYTLWVKFSNICIILTFSGLFLCKAGVHKSWTPGRSGVYILYGDAKYLWALGMGLAVCKLSDA